MEFRLLRADEIDVRIATVGSWGVSLLLYKDARCDQTVLDESVGALNWQRHHSRENANCIVSIWDPDKNQWIEKEDTGTESYTEKEKGLASDSFKRACFNWGIGRELYTAPNMFVYARDLKTLEERNGKWTCKDFFEVVDIQYEDRKIKSVQIVNTKTGGLLTFGESAKSKDQQKPLAETANRRITKAEQKKLMDACAQAGPNMSIEKALEACNKTSIDQITKVQYQALMSRMGQAA